MLLISFARRVTAPRCLCSTSPFNANARRNSAAPSPVVSMPLLLYAPAARRTSASSHVLWPLISRSAGQPQPCQRLSSLRHRRSSPLQFLALSSLSIAEHSLAAAERICSAAYRVISHLFRRDSEQFEAIARLLDAHRCNSSAIRVTAILLLLFAILSASIAHLCGTNRFSR